MGNCCLSACDLLFENGGAAKDPRVLYHTCSIHPNGSSEECGHRSGLGAYGSWSVLGKENEEEISSQYELGEELGRGQFGVIRLCTERSSGSKYACKSIAKAKLTTVADVRDVQREIQIMQQLSGHPNIVELKDVFEDQTWVHLVMELCEGGELFDRIVEKKVYSERDAAQVCKILIEVLQFCHANGVIHRDLKPENILLTSKSHPTPLKVADFGLALRFRPGETHSGMAGSAYYIAPEVLRGEYGQEIDVWSAGVVLYVLLSGVPPFWDELEEGIFDAIRYGHLDLSSDPWPKRSAAVKDLIRGMLCSDIKRRLTPGQILNHEWIVKNTSSIDGELPPPSSPLDASLGSWRSWQTLPSASSVSSNSSDTGFVESLLSSKKESSESFKGFLFGASIKDEQRDGRSRPPASSPGKCRQRFDKWTSFTQIMEPTLSEFVAMVVSSLDGVSPRANARVEEAEEGCSCTVVKASRSKRTVAVTCSRGKFLVVHDREHRRIGWKHLTEQQPSSCRDGVVQATPELDKLLWSPYPVPQAAH